MNATPTETEITKIWCSVLQMDGINADDSFFELGGDSIKAMQMIAFVRQLGIQLELQTLLEHHSIRALARHVDMLATFQAPGGVSESTLTSDEIESGVI